MDESTFICFSSNEGSTGFLVTNDPAGSGPACAEGLEPQPLSVRLPDGVGFLQRSVAPHLASLPCGRPSSEEERCGVAPGNLVTEVLDAGVGQERGHAGERRIAAGAHERRLVNAELVLNAVRAGKRVEGNGERLRAHRQRRKPGGDQDNDQDSCLWSRRFLGGHNDPSGSIVNGSFSAV